MGNDWWSFGVSGSKHTMDFSIDLEEESDEDDDSQVDYVCPFCLEDFDLVGFCCHVDDGHPVEAKSGICPICTKRVGVNMAVHIITQHGSILKTLHKKKWYNGGSRSIPSLFRVDSEDEDLQPFAEESSHMVCSSDVTADPLLAAFIYNTPPAHEPEILQPNFTSEAKLADEMSDDNMLERDIHASPLPNKDQEEKSQRCEFVRGLLYSTIFDDDL